MTHSTPPFSGVQLFQLSNAVGLRVQVMDRGATWLSCALPLPEGGHREVVLACQDLPEFERHRCYLGAAIGRFTNRIRNARFTVDGQEYLLVANQDQHQLHGGPDAFDRRFWQCEQTDARTLVCQLTSPDGDQGYPGELQAQVIYQLGEDLSVNLTMSATVSAPCPVGLTTHAYFNLDGDQGGATPSCLDHQIRVNADHWMPVDAECLPAPTLSDVGGTGLDLRSLTRLRETIAKDPVLAANNGFDHSLSFNPSACQASGFGAELISGDQRVHMRLSTNQPAVQIFTGNGLGGVLARDGKPYANHAGIALEPQHVPDSPNHAVEAPFWPDCVVRHGQTWTNTMRFQFTVV